MSQREVKINSNSTEGDDYDWKEHEWMYPTNIVTKDEPG